MSNLYITEPPTNGKVLLTTNRGEIEVELWSREAPKACRNFIQLCLEGYYLDTIFHRIVPDFIIQGGDPTATGTGGQSIYDAPFQDEFHSRLKFSRRGLLGSANNGKNDNGSQFFITLASAQELNGKNTLFGRVVGDTIYNVTKIGSSELEEGTERPLYPARITKTEVIVNPFPDILPRTTHEALQTRQQAQSRENAPVPKIARRNKKMLSFGDDVEDDSQENAPLLFKGKGNKSSHDLLPDAHLVSSDKANSIVRRRRKTPSPEPEARKDIPVEEERSTTTRAKSTSPPPPPPITQNHPKPDAVQAQIDALTASLKRRRPGSKASDPTQPPPSEKPKLSYLEEQRLRYSQKAILGGRKKRRQTDESKLLAKLSQFQQKISSAKPQEPEPGPKEERLCPLHGIPNCFSCNSTDPTQSVDSGTGRVTEGPTMVPSSEEEEDNANDDSWYAHRLISEPDRLGKDFRFKERAEMELEMIDPREKAGRLALEQRDLRRRRDEESGRNQYLRRDTGRQHK